MMSANVVDRSFPVPSKGDDQLFTYTLSVLLCAILSHGCVCHLAGRLLHAGFAGKPKASPLPLRNPSTGRRAARMHARLPVADISAPAVAAAPASDHMPTRMECSPSDFRQCTRACCDLRTRVVWARRGV
eukprot:4487342-Pleurochrysis_carterae.AAC.3